MKNIILLLVFYLSALSAYALPPTTIYGPTSVCVGSTITLSDSTTGGTWASNNVAIATIGSSSGLVTGISAGVDFITYNFSGGGFVTYPVTVYATPAAITGPSVVCTGSAITLLDISAGSTWSSSNSACASVSPTGVVTGVSAPCVATISYGNAACGYTVHPVTVNATPAAITGTMNVCLGYTTTLSDATAGGTWSSSNPACVTVNASTGVCTGVSAPCCANITYTLPTGCYSTATVCVYALPAAIAGTLVICQGSTSTLTCTPGGGVWSGGSPCVSINAATGVVSGLTAPCTGTVTYTLSTGCYTTATVTVNPLPPACIVSGGGGYCVGSPCPHVLLNCSQSGISYQLYKNGIATTTINPGTGSAIDFGPQCAAGTYTIVATDPTTLCTRTMTGSATVTVWPLPPACTLTGGGICCAGSTGVPIGLSCSSLGINYQLYCGTTPVGSPVAGTGAAISFGLFCTPCTYTVVATDATTGCTNTMTGSVTVTVAPLPTVFNVSGGGSYCDSSSGCPHVQLNGSQLGVTYKIYCGTTLMGTMPGTGSALDFGPRCVSCTYTIVATDNTTGCTNNMLGSATVSITAPPAAISGTTTIVCPATTTTLADATPGGSWSSSNAACATVSPAGVVTMGTAGPCTAVITYMMAPGCYATVSVSVPAPCTRPRDTTSCCIDSIAVNTGYDPVTNSALAPGTNCNAPVRDPKWVVSSETPDIAAGLPGYSCPFGSTVGILEVPAGLVQGINSADVIDSSGNPCWIATATGHPAKWISCVNSSAFNTIPGSTCRMVMTRPFTMCKGDTVTINLNISYDNYIYTVNIDGGANFFTPTYTGGFAICSTAQAYSPASITLYLSAGIHYINVDVLNYTPGGGMTDNSAGLKAWGFVKSVHDSGSLVNQTRPVPCCCYGCEITGTKHICVGGTTTLSSCSGGCTWSSNNTAIATVNSCTGVVTGVAGGTAIITHVSDIGCVTTITITVEAAPTACTVTGGGSYCPGPCLSCPHVGLSCSQVGVNYQLYCGSTAVPPVLAGTGGSLDFGPQCGPCTYTIKATNDEIGCTSNMTGSVTSTPLPACVISGPTTVCVGNNITLSSSCTASCPWSSGSTSIATVGCTGIVHGVSAGMVNITYTSVNGCISVYTVTVTGTCPITGTLTVCVGTTTTLSAAPCTGGIWSSSNPACVTVGAATGVCTGISAPCCATISYTNTSGCISTTTVCVLTAPATPTVTPPTSICLPGSTALTGSAVPAGSFSSWILTGTTYGSLSCTSNCSSTTFTGSAPGVQTITYIVYNACGSRSATTTVSVNTLPPITGVHSVCQGLPATISITGAPSGTWTSYPTGIVSIFPATSTTTTVTGLTPGTTTLTYTTASGCPATWTFTVNPTPTVTGGLSLCAGLIYLNDLTGSPSPGTWTGPTSGPAVIVSSTSSTATIQTFSAGVSMIVYTVNATGCFKQVNVTVNALPVISGPPTMCMGTTVSMTILSSFGTGTWSILPANPHVSINTGTGLITTTGTITTPNYINVYYTDANGCRSLGHPITVYPQPVINGASTICISSTSSVPETNSLGGTGVWSLLPATPFASNTPILGSSTNVSGLSPGYVTLKFVASPSGCIAYKTLHVLGLPNPGTLTVTPGSFCVGALGVTVNMGGADFGGSWLSSCSFVLIPTYTGTAPIVSTSSWGGIPPTEGCGIIYTVANACGTRASSTAFIVDACGHKEGRDGGDGVSEVIIGAQLKVFPNPNQGTFTVNLQSDKDEAAFVKVANIVGETVSTFQTVTNKENSVLVEKAAGIYLITVTTPSGIYTAKVVVE